MNRADVARLLYTTFTDLHVQYNPLEAINNYEYWTPLFYRDFLNFSNRLPWFCGFYRDFLTALIIDLRSLTIHRLQSVDLSSIKSESEKQDTNVIEAAWP